MKSCRCWHFFIQVVRRAKSDVRKYDDNINLCPYGVNPLTVCPYGVLALKSRGHVRLISFLDLVCTALLFISTCRPSNSTPSGAVSKSSDLTIEIWLFELCVGNSNRATANSNADDKWDLASASSWILDSLWISAFVRYRTSQKR